MAENDGYWFWQRYSGLYDLFMRKDRRAYDTLSMKRFYKKTVRVLTAVRLFLPVLTSPL